MTTAEIPSRERFRIAVSPDEVRPGFSWPGLFGNGLAVELEIGVGKAGFLIRRALARPDRNFLGIEWANEFYRYAVDRMERRGVSNVRLLRADAGVFMREACPRDSLECLHVYHPDPWPKRRHHKRRLFQSAFVDAASRCLKPPPSATGVGGRLAVQTDHAEYFAFICERIRANASLRETPFVDPACLDGFLGDGAADDDAPQLGTNFEIKYRKEGRAIYQLAAMRVRYGA